MIVRRIATLVTGILLGPVLGSAVADIGVPLVTVREEGFEVQILASPAPLRVGASEWNVNIRDLATGRILPGAVLGLGLRRIASHTSDEVHHHGGATIKVELDSEIATRGLFQKAQVEIIDAGRWSGVVSVSSGGTSAQIPFTFEVQPARSIWLRHWIAFAIVPIGLLIAGLHQWLVHNPDARMERHLKSRSGSTAPRRRARGR